MSAHASITDWTTNTKEGAAALRRSWAANAARRAAVTAATFDDLGINPQTGLSTAPTPPQNDRERRTLTRHQVTPLDAARSRQPRRARTYRAATWSPPTTATAHDWTREPWTTREPREPLPVPLTPCADPTAHRDPAAR